jgi:zinc transporter 9
VLGVSGVLESHSLYVAVNTLRRRAAQQGMSLLAYVKTGADPAATAVMMEDGAAVAGLFIAGGCLALYQVGNIISCYILVTLHAGVKFGAAAALCQNCQPADVAPLLCRCQLTMLCVEVA